MTAIAQRFQAMRDLAALEHQHSELEREIADLLAHPSSDPLRIVELKRRKLQVKDEIAGLSR